MIRLVLSLPATDRLSAATFRPPPCTPKKHLSTIIKIYQIDN